MIFNGKNYNFALAVVTTISTMAVSAVAQADPNPYLLLEQSVAPASSSTAIYKTPAGKKPVNSKIRKKIDVIAPGGVLNDPNTGAIHVKEGPIIVNKRDTINQSGAKSSAVDVERSVKSVNQ
jgi:hypothetical protein